MDFVKIWPQRADMEQRQSRNHVALSGKNILKMMRIP